MKSKRKRGFKIYFFIILIFIAIVGIVLYIAQSRTNSIISELTLVRAQTANKALVNFLKGLKNESLRRAEIMSGSESLVYELKNGSYENLKRELSNLGQGLDFATICDARGVVLARMHNDIKGDDISDHSAISAIIKEGREYGKLEDTPTIGLCVRASAALYYKDEFIGIVACGFYLNRNDQLDTFKEQNGCEASIIYNGKRVSTTITDEYGVRVSGRTVDTNDIDAILDRESGYSGRIRVFNGTYQSYYSKITVGDDSSGILFTGIDITSTLAKQRSMNRLIILVSIIGFIAAGILIMGLNRLTRLFAHTLEKLFDKEKALDVLKRMLNGMDIFLYADINDILDTPTNEVAEASLEDKSDAVNNRPAKDVPNKDSAKNIFVGKRILLADDVEINREILIALLDETGVAIDCAKNGREAYDKFAAAMEIYDMILMDIHMPDMDGYEATKSIRKIDNDKARTIPIIAVTADIFSKDIASSPTGGMNDYIGKPLDMEIVISKMKQYLL